MGPTYGPKSYELGGVRQVATHNQYKVAIPYSIWGGWRRGPRWRGGMPPREGRLTAKDRGVLPYLSLTHPQRPSPHEIGTSRQDCA